MISSFHPCFADRKIHQQIRQYQFAWYLWSKEVVHRPQTTAEDLKPQHFNEYSFPSKSQIFKRDKQRSKWDTKFLGIRIGKLACT